MNSFFSGYRILLIFSFLVLLSVLNASKASFTYEQNGGTGSINKRLEPKSFSLFSSDVIPFFGFVFN